MTSSGRATFQALFLLFGHDICQWSSPLSKVNESSSQNIFVTFPTTIWIACKPSSFADILLSPLVHTASASAVWLTNILRVVKCKHHFFRNPHHLIPCTSLFFFTGWQRKFALVDPNLSYYDNQFFWQHVLQHSVAFEIFNKLTHFLRLYDHTTESKINFPWLLSDEIWRSHLHVTLWEIKPALFRHFSCIDWLSVLQIVVIWAFYFSCRAAPSFS